MINFQSTRILLSQLFCAFKFGSVQRAIFVKTTLILSVCVNLYFL